MTDERSGNLVKRWQAGDQQAAAELFRRYANRLIALARSRLPNRLAQRVDPEDVVQSVYRSFFAGARDDQFDVQRGGDLWRLLVTITLNKVQDQVRRHTRGKRAVGREKPFGSEDSLLGLRARLHGREPSPVEAVALVEQLETLLRGLDPLPRRMLELRLQGHNLEEIAAQTCRSQRSVIRALQAIERRLEQQSEGNPEAPA